MLARTSAAIAMAFLVAMVRTPAQDAAAPAPAAGSDPRLEQLVAPVALYPDALLAQVLIAATYPLEIVEAARWQEQHKSMTGNALEAALKDQPWDPSVKSLVGLPAVLARMNTNLDWTKDLGDAFLADQAKLMDVVQQMRRKALEAGTLKSSKEQKVTERDDKIIVIEVADPEIVYVPTYYPTEVYGGWAYPTYYYPPLYAPPPPRYLGFTFLVGVAWGAAIWGGCHWGWGHTEIDIDVDHYHDFVDRTEPRERASQLKERSGDGKWKHDAGHRQGVAYRDQRTAQQFGRADAANRVSRDQARGRVSSGGTSGLGLERPATRPAARPETRPSTPQRTTQSGSFTGSRNASLERAASQRGSASRGASRGGGRSGGGRGGGGRGR